MSDRIKCSKCDNMILEITAKVNHGLCGRCKIFHDKDVFEKIVQGWIDNPETLPGTNGIPEPEDFGLRLRATQMRRERNPSPEDIMEMTCHRHFNAALNKWSFLKRLLLTKKEKYTLAIETFYGETANGGIEQYLDHESGAFANWSVDAFEAIGLSHYAEIMKKVKKLFPNGKIPQNDDKRCDLVEEIDEDILDQIDDEIAEFYNADRDEIRRTLFEYLK